MLQSQYMTSLSLTVRNSFKCFCECYTRSHIRTLSPLKFSTQRDRLLRLDSRNQTLNSFVSSQDRHKPLLPAVAEKAQFFHRTCYTPDRGIKEREKTTQAETQFQYQLATPGSTRNCLKPPLSDSTDDDATSDPEQWCLRIRTWKGQPMIITHSGRARMEYIPGYRLLYTLLPSN
jgi:hypothetical protein